MLWLNVNDLLISYCGGAWQEGFDSYINSEKGAAFSSSWGGEAGDEKKKESQEAKMFSFQVSCSCTCFFLFIFILIFVFYFFMERKVERWGFLFCFGSVGGCQLNCWWLGNIISLQSRKKRNHHRSEMIVSKMRLSWKQSTLDSQRREISPLWFSEVKKLALLCIFSYKNLWDEQGNDRAAL